MGRSGRWQALRQSHLQLSQSMVCMPNHPLKLSLKLSSQLGPRFLLITRKVYRKPKATVKESGENQGKVMVVPALFKKNPSGNSAASRVAA